MSVPHITSGASTMVPSCAFGPCAWPGAAGPGGRTPASHPFLRGPNPVDPQLRPGLPVPLAMKRRGFEHPAKVGHQDVVRGSAGRPAATTRRRGPCRLRPRIHTGAGAADPLHAIRPTGGDRPLIAVDLRRAKGPPASSWSTFAYSNSLPAARILACSGWSSSRASGRGSLASARETSPKGYARGRDPHRATRTRDPPRATDAALAPGRRPRPARAVAGRELSQSSVQENPRAGTGACRQRLRAHGRLEASASRAARWGGSTARPTCASTSRHPRAIDGRTTRHAGYHVSGNENSWNRSSSG